MARLAPSTHSSHMLVSAILAWSAFTTLSTGLSVSAVSLSSLSQEVGQNAVLIAEKLEHAVEGLWEYHVDEESQVDDEYVGKQVYRLEVPEIGLSRQQKRELVEEVRNVASLLDLDIWRLSPTHLDILIPHSHLSILSNLLPKSISLPTTPFLSSIQLSKLTRPRRPQRPSPPSEEPTWNTSTITTAYHDAYHPLVNISAFMDALVQDFNGVAEKVVIGKSAEGRDIEGLKLHLPTDGDGDGMDMMKKKKRGKWMRWTERFRTTSEEDEDEGKEIFLMGGQHAREWVSPATILYFAHRLLLDSEHDYTTRRLLESFTFTLVPTINPDGYAYTHEHSRLWRKNRQDVGAGSCKGIDMNANWGYKWSSSPSLMSDGSINAYSNPCSDSFPGNSAFQAVETRAIADYLHARQGTMRAFIDMHSYGQLFMFPYSYSCSDFPGDAETLMEAGLGVAKAIKVHSGTQYKTGQACDLVYRMAGDSIDFAYGEEGIRWAYSAELRDTGTYGFLLPPREIRPTAEEMTAGLLYLAEFIRTTELGPRG